MSILAASTLLQGCWLQKPDLPTITVGESVIFENPGRFGVNIGRHAYYGDQQIISDPLLHGDFRKGQQSLLIRVGESTANTITDNHANPEKPNRNYHDTFEGGTYTIATGARAGETGTIVGHVRNTATFTLEHVGVPLRRWDVVWLRGPYVERAGPERESGEPGIGIGEFRLLEPREEDVVLDFVEDPDDPSDQYLRLTFPNDDKRYRQGVKHYLRVRPGGAYEVHVRARSVGPSARLSVSIIQLALQGGDGGRTLQMTCDRDATLGPQWQDYVFSGTVIQNTKLSEKYSRLELAVSKPAKSAGGEVLIDWIRFRDLAQETTSGFNRDIVDALIEARCGVLRFHGLTNPGTTVDSLTARSVNEAPWSYRSHPNRYSRDRTGAVLDDMLGLCREVDAKPWFSIGATNSPDDWYNLISYLCAPDDFDEYSRRRADHGIAGPWTESMDKIYLEVGNELWNIIFFPFHIWTPERYGELCTSIIRRAKSHPHFDASKIEFIVGGWAANARSWNVKVDSSTQGHTRLSIAPYLLHRLDAYHSPEAKYGTLFADVEGYMKRAGDGLLKDLRKSDTGLAVYELNTHLTKGESPASVASEICPSGAAGIAVLDHAMNLMQRMQPKPVTYFTLLQRAYGRGDDTRVGLWGNLIRELDRSLRARPVWHGLRLANQYLIDGDMVETEIRGGPTWKQPANGSVPAMRRVPYLHAYSFMKRDPDTGKRQLNVLIINRHLTEPIVSVLRLPFEPKAEGKRIALQSNSPSDHNEDYELIKLVEEQVDDLAQHNYLNIPPLAAVVYQIQER